MAQLIGNYSLWQQGGGYPETVLLLRPRRLIFTCLTAVFRPPYGIYGIFICIGLLAVLVLLVMRMGYSDTENMTRPEFHLFCQRKSMVHPAG